MHRCYFLTSCPLVQKTRWNMMKDVYSFHGSDGSATRGDRIPGLSDRIEIESCFVIKLNVFAEIKSKQMENESNNIFDFQYDLVWFDLEENVSKKTRNCGCKNTIISKDGTSNEIFHYFRHPGGQSLWNGPIYWWLIKFKWLLRRICIESNRFLNWIYIESEPNRIERFLQHLDWKSNQIETNSIWQPCWIQQKRLFAVQAFTQVWARMIRPRIFLNRTFYSWFIYSIYVSVIYP